MLVLVMLSVDYSGIISLLWQIFITYHGLCWGISMRCFKEMISWGVELLIVVVLLGSKNVYLIVVYMMDMGFNWPSL